MVRKYFIPFVFVTLVAVIDLVSYSPQPVSNTIGYIESYVESLFKAHKALLLDEDNLELFRTDSLDSEALNSIKRLERQVGNKGLHSRLYEDDELIFWTNQQSDDTICRIFRQGRFSLELCKVILEEDGTISHDIEHNSFLDRSSAKDDGRGSSLEKWASLPGLKLSRPYRMNVIILIIYSLVILSCTMLCLHFKDLTGMALLISGRILLHLSSWHERFANVHMTESIFNAFSYSSIDLLWDSILIFGILSLTSLKTPVREPQNLRNVSINLVFFTLLTLAHIRVIQLLVESDNVLNAFNDLSQLNLKDLTCLFAVLVLQAGIFLIGYRTFLAFAKLKYSRLFNYTMLLGFAFGATALAWLIKLELNHFVLLFFLVSYYLLFDLFVDVRSKNMTWIIWWAIFYSVYLSALFFNYDIRKNLAERFNRLSVIIEEVPHEKIAEIKASFILDSLNGSIEELLTLPDEATYDKNDIESYTADKFGLKGIEIEVFDSLGNYIFDKSAYLSSRESLISVDSVTEYDEVNNKIWFGSTLPSGYMVKTALPYYEVAALPKLEFNYYRNGKLVKEDHEIEPATLELIKSSNSRYLYKDSKAYVIYKPSESKLLVAEKAFSGLIKPIALFSLIFCFVVVLSIILGIGHAIFSFLPEEWPFRIVRFDSLNSKIQISLILVILLSFVIIAAITNSFLSNYLSGEKDRFIEDKISTISNEISKNINIAQSPREALIIAANFEKEIEDIHNVKLEVLSLLQGEGRLDYFTSRYFGQKKDPLPYTDKADDEFISYMPLTFRNNQVGVLRIDHQDLSNEKSYVVDFLGSIFNVYVFFFLIASVIAIFIARSVTRPLDLLNQKLQALKLGSRNELIDWERDDEIGSLINNYNNMVHQLEESARILAKTERDSAWREMAKQVAHEIKNPLTPIKLSIQYLEKAIKQNPEKAREISKRISSTLLEQIENLTEIANAFSNFAEMPQSSNVKIELNEVVEIVHNLFRKRGDMDVFLSEPIDPVYVYADKNQLIRILNNLVKNAIESIPDSRRGKIDLKLEKKMDKAIISVSDNGVGIPAEMEEKIFQPKFTTKDSGSGLGLAICANMIESMNGRIYFESVPGEGTNFFIELDVMRPSYYIEDKERIALE